MIYSADRSTKLLKDMQRSSIMNSRISCFCLVIVWSTCNLYWQNEYSVVQVNTKFLINPQVGKYINTRSLKSEVLAKLSNYLNNWVNIFFYKFKWYSKMECCKQCRYVKFKSSMTKWPVQKQTHWTAQNKH